MSNVLLWITAFFVVWPLHSTAAMVGDKPVELMLSDVLWMLMPLIYVCAKSFPSKTQLNAVRHPIRPYRMTPTMALLFIAYATTLAGLGMGMSGEIVRLYSAFKLVKPIGFVFLGMLLGEWTDPFDFVGIMGWVYGIVGGLTLFFTVSSPEFPAGEWGKYLFEWELNGYPNSPMSFYAALIPLLIASAESSRHRFVPVVGWILAAGLVLVILGSMSRSSTLVLIFGLMIYLITTGRTALLAGGFVALMVFSVIGFGLFSVLKETEVVSVLGNRVQERLERSTESEDPSSGRFEIWQLAVELGIERPIFGYMFESFSRYSEYDTPHQQYLEVLHKCGGLGLLLYLTLIGSGFKSIVRLQRMAPTRSPPWYMLRAIMAMLVGLMVGNFTQPNFTYSLTGNMVFLLLGLFCSARAVVSASQPRLAPQRRAANFNVAPPRQIPRIAA